MARRRWGNSRTTRHRRNTLLRLNVDAVSEGVVPHRRVKARKLGNGTKRRDKAGDVAAGVYRSGCARTFGYHRQAVSRQSDRRRRQQNRCVPEVTRELVGHS